jgi:tetratricopeptide (TPR) repeat protein
MKEHGLTVGMILWQEGSTLEGVLQSLKPIVDKFILGVDAKSTDDTAKIARKWANDYFEFDFQDNFSLARNMVLNRCNTEWFMQVDGHEFLDSGSIECIGEHVGGDKDTEVVYLSLNIWNEYEPLLLFLAPRMFRADAGIRYMRRIHNTLTHVDGYERFLSLNTVHDHGIILDHKQPEKRHKKRAGQRKEISESGMIEQALDKNDAYDWYNLGVWYTHEGRGEEAIAAFTNALETCNRGDVRYQIKIFLAGIHKQQGERDKAKETLSSASIDDPKRCEHLVELGALYEEEDKLNDALMFYSMAELFPITPGMMTVYLPYYSYFPIQRKMEIYGRQGRLIKAMDEGKKLREFKYFQHQKQLQGYMEHLQSEIGAKMAGQWEMVKKEGY